MCHVMFYLLPGKQRIQPKECQRAREQYQRNVTAKNVVKESNERYFCCHKMVGLFILIVAGIALLNDSKDLLVSICWSVVGVIC